MRKKFGIFLITLGLLLFGAYFAGRFIPTYYSNKDISQDVSHEQMVSNKKKEFKNNFDAVNNISTKNTLMNFTSIDQEGIIGQIIIPDEDISLPINYGVTDEHLLSGSATMREDQEMGVGNYPLAGHYVSKNGPLFSRIHNLTKGQKIFVTDKDTIFEYEVIDKVMTDQYAFYMLEDDMTEQYNNKPIISLMTCDIPTQDAENRVFVIGELINSFPYEESYFK
ncbi:MAG: class A sortase [Finegoldia sp.]|nr:class A sortase [Finegoldia sp.]